VRTLVAAVLLAASPLAAAAGEGLEVGFEVGARLSVALPMGAILDDSQNGPLLIDELVTVSLPLQLDAGVKLDRRLFVGAYVQYGWDLLQIGQCDVGQACSLTGLRVGAEVLWTLEPEGASPWLGLGTGWEWLFTSYSSASFKTNLDVSGWEWFNLQAGYDVPVAPGWRVGIFASGSVGQFSQATVTTNGQGTNGSIPDKAVHGWLNLGVKGTFGL
jgi:hypothetical protein